MRSIKKLLERDRQREKDGFHRKVRIGRFIKPSKKGRKVVVVPVTEEEKFVHVPVEAPEEEGGESGGQGEGEEGEVIGREPIHDPDGEGSGAGEGGGGEHGLSEEGAYELGKILTEEFELPNLQDKGKKKSLVRHTYDLTDKHQGTGQLLDKKATLRKILETNIALGKVTDIGNIDSTEFVVGPRDKIYRILSEEREYESQAVVFFLRDYSYSMSGRPTELVVSQHVLIYAWLLYQYAERVETRFILHDAEAKEVPDFYTYYNSKVAGGTKVVSAFRLVNEIVKKEGLASDYNIYVFHGTDGDDWDSDGTEMLEELKIMLGYANRIGVTVVLNDWNPEPGVKTYLEKSGLLTSKPDLLRMDVMPKGADEDRLIEGIKRLVSP